jgi:hypothetical protein
MRFVRLGRGTLAAVELITKVHNQIHATALQQPGQLALHAGKAESRNAIGLELHQPVDVGVRAEVVAKSATRRGCRR